VAGAPGGFAVSETSAKLRLVGGEKWPGHGAMGKMGKIKSGRVCVPAADQREEKGTKRTAKILPLSWTLVTFLLPPHPDAQTLASHLQAREATLSRSLSLLSCLYGTLSALPILSHSAALRPFLATGTLAIKALAGQIAVSNIV
jgi:hypothetical protein